MHHYRIFPNDNQHLSATFVMSCYAYPVFSMYLESLQNEKNICFLSLLYLSSLGLHSALQ